MNSRFLHQMDANEFKAFLKEIFKEMLIEENLINSDKELLSIKEASAFLNLAVATLYEKTSERTIPHYKNGKKVTFKRSELLAWLQSTKVKTNYDAEADAKLYTQLNRR